MTSDKELITENPFAILVRRMNRIEYQNEQILSFLQNETHQPNTTTPYGDFNWLLTILPIPESTLRQKIAKDEIPGVKKVGKRLLFEKAVVLTWLSSNNRLGLVEVEQSCEDSFVSRHQRKGGRKAA